MEVDFNRGDMKVLLFFDKVVKERIVWELGIIDIFIRLCVIWVEFVEVYKIKMVWNCEKKFIGLNR